MLKPTTLFGFIALAVLYAVTLMAQTETGQITGTVLDATRAVVEGATVTAVHSATHITRTATSSASGTYVLPNLLPGTYEMTATAPGFQTVKQNVIVRVGIRAGVDIHMEVGEVATIIEVAGRPVQVNTETQTLSQNISGQEVLQLPTITRNPYDLILTSGNISDAEGGGRGPGSGVAINGLRASSTNVLLDGVANNNEFDTTVGIQVPLDSVAEFSILTSAFTAEYGRASGGVVNVATKQGTNSIHGTAYEFNRASALASNTFDNNANNIRKPVFIRNQFGYSIGGPIKKNKLFFFNNTEWLRVRSQSTKTAVVATPQLIAASAPNTQQFYQRFGRLLPNIVPLQTFSRGEVCAEGPCTSIPAGTPIYQRVAYNVPSGSGGGNPQNTYMLVGRFDYNHAENTQIYFRFARYSADTFPGTQTDSPYDGYNTAVFETNDGYAFSVTHTFSPRWITQTKLSYNRVSELQPLGTPPVSPTLYTTLTSTSQLGNSSILYPGYSPRGPGTAIPFGGPQNHVSLHEDASYTAGSHNFRFGGLFAYLQDNRTFGAFQNAVAALGTNISTALNNLIAGQLHDFQAAVDPQGKFPCIGGVQTPECTVTLPVGPPNFSRSNRYRDAALYAQDTWKVNPHLTLNLGLRWEYYGPQVNKDPQLDSNFYPGPGANIQLQMQTGQVMIAPQSPVGGLWARRWRNFAPRLGFALDVFGDQKTSLRGGWGMSYERNFNNVTFNVLQNPPGQAVLLLTAGTDVPSIPLTTDNAGPLAGSVGSKALPITSLRAVDPQIKTAYAHQWSLALEHQLSNNAVAGLEYSGSRGLDLYSVQRLNIGGSAPVYGGFGTPRQRINSQYSLINFRMNGGESFYNGLNARLELRNLSPYGLTLRANYTWSHSIDNASNTFVSSELRGIVNLGFMDTLNPNLDRGSSDYDIRHRFIVSAMWDIPYRRTSRAMELIAGGWSLMPIVEARTGTPFSVFDCTNSDNALCPRAMFDTPFRAQYTSTPTANPNQFNYLDLGNPNSSYINRLSNSSDFGPFPPTMSGRNIFHTPGVWKFTIGINKNFSLTERFKLQFRGEAFNVFNHSNLYIVYSNREVSSFPRDPVTRQPIPIVTATRGIRNDSNLRGPTVENRRIENRNFQLALKLIF